MESREKKTKKGVGVADTKQDGQGKDVIDTSDYKVTNDGKKYKAHRIIFNKGEDDGKKGVSEQMKKTFNTFVEQHMPRLTEEQLKELEQELNEVLGKDAKAGDWIHDFVHSDNPKFAGKSKEKRKQMALAAYYAKQRNEEAEIAEALKGGQVKLDKNKNGKLDAQDFKMLRKEDLDEELHPEAGKVLKHIKPEHQAKYKPDLAKGVYKGDYADRTAVLKAAKAAGHLNEEAQHIDEAINANDYNATSEKSQFGGHRPHIVHKKTAKTMMLGQHSYKSPEHAKAHAQAYLSAYAKTGMHAADRAGHDYAKLNKDKQVVKEELEEGWNDMLAHVKKAGEATKTSTATKHDVKRTSTGTVYTKQRDADGMSKEFKRDPGEAKRGRGRPKKNTFSEAVEFLMALSEEQFEDFMSEGFDTFFETYDQLDEVSKATLGSYIKKATNGMSGVAINAHQAGGAAPGTAERKIFLAKANKRIDGIAKAADRLSK
jgi:hypothetical protein